MILLDTHAWLWWVSSPERLSATARELIDASASVGISAISCWEVAMLALRGRIGLDRDVRTWLRAAIAQERTEAIPVSTEIAIEAALLEERGFPGDPADRIIFTTAALHGAPLVTRDRSLRSVDPVRTVW